MKGHTEYTEKTLEARTKFLAEKATKAATEAGRFLKIYSATPASDAITTAPSPATAAEAIAYAVDTTKRCAEGAGNLYRERPELVNAEDFISAYEQYANARKTQVEFGRLRLVKSLERNKQLVAGAAENLEDASRIAEARQKAEESKRFLEEAEAELAEFKPNHEKLNAVLEALKGGDDLARTQGTEILVENPRAVWAKIRNYPPAKDGRKQLTLDTATADEAAIAQEVYSISQNAVNEAKALAGVIEEAVKALDATDEKDEEARKKKERKPKERKKKKPKGRKRRKRLKEKKKQRQSNTKRQSKRPSRALKSCKRTRAADPG